MAKELTELLTPEAIRYGALFRELLRPADADEAAAGLAGFAGFDADGNFVRSKPLAVSVSDFAPASDGIADDTAKVLAAWNSARSGDGGIYIAPEGLHKTPGTFPVGVNYIKPTYMRMTKATRMALFDGSSEKPNAVDDDPVFWTQKHTAYDNGTDKDAQSTGVLHETIVYGSNVGSNDVDGTWNALIGNTVLLGKNVGTESAPEYDLRGAAIGITGFARSEKPAGITTGLWGYAVTPEMSQTEFDAYDHTAAGNTGFPTVGMEVNIDIRHPVGALKTFFGGKGVTAGYLGYNYRARFAGVKDWDFGFILSGTANDGDFLSTDMDNWSGFRTGLKLDFIKNFGILVGGYLKTGAYGIKFADTYAGDNDPRAAIGIGNSKIDMGQYLRANWQNGDFWHNGGNLWFRTGDVNTRLLREAAGLVDLTKTAASLEVRLRGIHSASPALTLQRATNSGGAPAAVANGDRLGAIFIGGYGSTDWFANASIESYAAEAWTDTARGQTLLFSTTAAGSNGRQTRLAIDDKGNIVPGTAALAAVATDGFIYLPTMPAAPSGVPSAKTGRAPIVIDTANNRLCAYINGAWRNFNPS